MRNIFSKKFQQERMIQRLIVEANEHAKDRVERYSVPIPDAVDSAYSRANPNGSYDIRVTFSKGNRVCERYYTGDGKSTLFYQEGTWWRKTKYLTRNGLNLKTYEKCSDGEWTKYIYNEQGLLVLEKSNDGSSKKVEYDSKGRETYRECDDADGEVGWEKTSYIDHPDGSHEVVIANKESWRDNASGRRIVRDKKGNISLFYSIDTEGNWTEKKYDKNGTITSVRTSESVKNSDL